MKIGYWAVFDETDKADYEYGIEISFPDVPGVYSTARTYEEGLSFAKEVLELATFDYLVKDLPKCSSKADIPLKAHQYLVWIEYETSEIDFSTYTFYDEANPYKLEDLD